MPHVYRLLGVFWFAVAIALLTLPWTLPNLAEFPIMANRVALGAFAFGLSCYNMIRYRMIAARKAALDEEYAERVKQRLGRGPINPDFDFSEPPKDTKPK